MQNYIPELVIGGNVIRNSSTKVLKDPFALFFYQCMVFILNRELGGNIRGFVTLTPYILKKEKKNIFKF